MKTTHILAKLGSCCALSAMLLLSACATKSPAPVINREIQSNVSTNAAPVTPSAPTVSNNDLYTVKKGDTLYGIALDHGLDYKDLLSWNAIENPNLIRIGQTLRVRAEGSPAISANAISTTVVVKPVATATPIAEQSTLENNSDTLKREPKVGKEPYSEQALAKASLLPKPTEVTNTATQSTAELKPKAASKPETTGENDELSWGWPASGKLLATFNEASNKGIDIAGKAGTPVLAAAEGKVVYSGTGLRGYGKLLIIKHKNAFLTAYAHNQNMLVKEGQLISKGQKIAEMGNTDSEQVKLHFEVRYQGKPVDPLKYLPTR